MSAANLLKKFRGVYAGPSHPSTDTVNNSDVEELFEFPVNHYKDAVDTSATTVTTATPIHYAGSDFTVISAHWTSQVTVTGDATSYATINLTKQDGTGSTKLTVASHATDSTGDGLTADTPKPLTLTSANVDVDEGSVLHFAIAKTSNGKKVQKGVLTVTCRKR